MMEGRKRYERLISAQGEINLVPPMLISRFSHLKLNPTNNAIQDNNMVFSSFLIMGDIVDIEYHSGRYFLKIDDGTGTMELMMITDDSEKHLYLYETSNMDPEDYLSNLVDVVRKELTNSCPPVASLKLGDCLLIHTQVSTVKPGDNYKMSGFKFHLIPKRNATEIKYDWYFSCLRFYLKKTSKA